MRQKEYIWSKRHRGNSIIEQILRISRNVIVGYVDSTTRHERFRQI